VQTEALVAPVVDEEVPVGQLRHCAREEAPVLGPYVPAGHATQVATEDAPVLTL